MFLSVVKRITESGEEKPATSTAAPGIGLKKALSKVDVSQTSLLLRSAFEVIFR
jgi:hypothetical protein